MNEKMYSQSKALPDEELCHVNGGSGTTDIFSITIKTGTSRVTVISGLCSETTVWELKRKVSEKSGYPAKGTMLVLKGTELKDNMTLGNYGIGAGDVILAPTIGSVAP